MRHLASALIAAAMLPAAGGAELPGKPILALDAGGHTALAWQVMFTPDGRELITVSDDKTVRFWDVRSGEPLRTLRPPIGRGKDGRLFASALTRDGRTLAVGGFGWGGDRQPIYLIGVESGKIERVLDGHDNAVLALSFAPDGRRLASGSKDRTARIWDVATGRCEQTLTGHGAHVYGIAFAPDGRRVATASYDTTGRIWSVADGRLEAVLRGHTGEVRCVDWRPDGQVIATGGYDQSIRLWGADGRAFQGLPGRESLVISLAFAPDSRSLLATWGGPRNIRGAAILDLATGAERLRFTQHTNTVQACAFSSDGRLAATIGGDDNETYLWRTADASPTHRLATRARALWSAAWSPDGTKVGWGDVNQGSALNADKPLRRAFRLEDLEFASPPDASYRIAQKANDEVSLVAASPISISVVRGGVAAASLTMAEPYDHIRCFTLLPGDRAAVGTYYGLYLFDTRNGQLLRKFEGHTGVVWAASPSPDGRWLLSASQDMTLRVWNPDRDEPLVSLFFAGDDWIAWTPEGYYAASPGGEKLIGWHLNEGPDRMATFHPAARFRKSLYRPDAIRRLLTAGSLEAALAAADQASGKPTKPVVIDDVLPPNVAITAPESSGLRFHERTLVVKAKATSVGANPVASVRLLLDGRPFRGEGGTQVIATPKLGEVDASWSVELEPGRHTLAAQADSAVSSAVSEAVAVVIAGGRATPDPVTLPTLYVLAVGVSEYPGDLRLNYAAKDAEAVVRAFREKSGTLYRKIEVRLLNNAQATRTEVLRGLSWLKQQMTQNDVGVVFFSGHGQRDEEGGLYFLPVDVDTSDLLATGVADGQLKKALAGMPGRIVALLDACHAGAIGGDRRKGTGGLTDDLVRDLVTDDYGVIVMASSMGREFSLESNSQRQGCFTVGLTEGLSGKADYNRDGVVYLNELDNYVTDRVKELTRGRQHPVTAKPTSIRSFPLAMP